MANLKSARHHWWPEVVSEHWKNAEGVVHWLMHTGKVRPAPPKNFGGIGNGHHIKLGPCGQPSPWDHSFEQTFQNADDNFGTVIQWLAGLDRRAVEATERSRRFLSQPDTDEQIRHLVEGIVSLAVRSPMNREQAVALAEDLRGPLSEHERNSLIGMNMRHCQRMVSDNIGTRGKFAVLYTQSREFIFGDGFYHNVTSPSVAPTNPKILVPLTPTMAVLYARPFSYGAVPRLSTIVLTEDEVEAVNHSVQVYAARAIFYRSDKPADTTVFGVGKHQAYARSDNPIERLISDLPGMPPRDPNLDRLFAELEERRQRR